MTNAALQISTFLYVKTDKYHIIPALYVGLSYIISFFVVQLKNTNFLRKQLNFTPHKIYKKSEVVSSKITKFLQLLIVVLIIGVTLYRTNKWWIINYSLTFNDTTTIEYIFWGIVLLVLLIGLTLLPTLLFSSENYIKYKLVTKFSEEFRTKYNFNKKEWYD